MIPVLSNQQVRSVEEATIAAGATVEELMERAGCVAAERILELEGLGHLGEHLSYVILAGKGNNGGDGLVVAFHLHERGRRVRVITIDHQEGVSGVVAERFDRLPREIHVDHSETSYSNVQFNDNEVIIDAVLGSGITRPVHGALADLFARVNSSRHPVVAIDVPSGTMDPSEGLGTGPTIQAHHTVTFQVPRLALVLPETGTAAGSWIVKPIGLDAKALESTERVGDWVEEADIRRALKPRGRFTHKGSHGHALVIAGGAGCHGAGVLAATGCARSGVGLLTVHGVENTIRLIGMALPDAMTSLDANRDHVSQLPDLERYTAVAFGPGVGVIKGPKEVLKELLGRWNGPLVLDADALSLLAQERDLLDRLSSRTVLTPHPKEMDRLLGSSSSSSYDRLCRAKVFAQEVGCTVVLKGAYTAVCSSDGRAYFNSTGNSGMAKGGTGDVLAGLLVGLLAQGYETLEASIIANYVHGLAGDFAAADLGVDAMRACDLVQYMPKAWSRLRRP
jgi:ADP-dependent NAD(P)H-hydrate dehydratase / NAD(P)H-hydrate epimerase